MTDVAVQIKPVATELPRYRVGAFASPESAERWLSEMATNAYRMVSMTTYAQTNHFSKEMESLVWIVVERQAP